jgi:hypothetical protein
MSGGRWLNTVKEEEEDLEQSISIWGLKLRCSSKRIPKSLKLVSVLLKEILSMAEIKAGSSGNPISVLL